LPVPLNFLESEVGVVGPSRDHSAAANQAFAGPLPKEFMDQPLTRLKPSKGQRKPIPGLT
jgi:hypothetical protein